ncbi:FIST C-terminal domain-containing protein [soil metagenome]
MDTDRRLRVVTGAGGGADVRATTRAAVGRVAAELGGERPDLAVVFMGAAYADEAKTVRDEVLEGLSPGHLIGVTAQGVVVDAKEIEHDDCLSLWTARMPGARVEALRYRLPDLEVRAPGDLDWPVPSEDATALVAFADPAGFPVDGFLAWLGQQRPALPVSGGLASGGSNRLLLDEEILEGGAVAVSLSGVRVRTMVSQGCRPIGNSYIVTRAERNLVHELGGVPPLDRVREMFSEADPTDRDLMRQGLHVGTVIDEYREEYGRGDFLVRGVLGAVPDSGALVLGDLVRVGQTVQFHVRDKATADQDLRELLDGFVEGGRPAGGLLFTCNGRGSHLFDVPSHDAGLVHEKLGAPLGGFFCAGELGPVGSRNFLHGFTASLLVVEDEL